MITKIDINDTKASGYLGNQLFMYAAMIGYAAEHFGENYKSHIVLPHWDVAQYLKYPPIQVENPLIDYEYREDSFHHNPIRAKKNLNISGYFQSYKYFYRYEKEVRDCFEFTSDFKQKVLAQKVAGSLSYNGLFQNSRVTGIHVRLGDYKSFPNHFTQLLQTGYYLKAIAEMFEETDYFLVFSNNIEEAKKYFDFSDDLKKKILYCYSEQDKSEGNKSAVADLYRMSCCSNFIMANSSMSWWGAWLIQNVDKKIIAPKNWFGPALAMNDTKDLIPHEWIKV